MSCVTWGRPVGFLTLTLGVCWIVPFILLKVLRAYCALTPLPLSTGYNNRTYEKVLVGITLQKGKGDVFRQPFSPCHRSSAHSWPGVRNSEIMPEKSKRSQEKPSLLTPKPSATPASPAAVPQQEVAMGPRG